jgi:hypothetical protein
VTPLEALYRCQRAWERTQPQLFFELWPDGGLDEREACRPSLVEPAATPQYLPRGGLAAGAEPCCDLLGTDGESSLFTAPPAWSGGSAPLINQTAPGRTSPEDVRDQGQEVTL